MSMFFLSFALQVAFNLTRTLNVKYNSELHVQGTLITGTINAVLWVMTTKYGIDAYNGSWLGMVGYIIGAATGIYAGMKLKARFDAKV